MLYVFDKNDILIDQISEYEDFEFEGNVNNGRFLKFSCAYQSSLKKYNKVGFFDIDKFELFEIDNPTELKYEDEHIINIECVADYYTLRHDIIEDKRIANGTIQEALEKALEGSGYRVGNVDQFENQTLNYYYISRLEALNEIIKAYKCEFETRIEIDESTGRIGSKYIDLKHRLGTDTGLRFTYDTNLVSVEKEELEGHFNVLYGMGKSLETENGGYSRKLDFAEVNNGKKYIEDIESINKYGRLEGIFESSETEDPSELLNLTRDKLQEIKEPRYSYTVNVEDLGDMEGFEHYKYQEGDTIIIQDEEADLILEARIIKISITEMGRQLTLGNIIPGLVENDDNKELNEIKDRLDIIQNSKPEIDESNYPNTLPTMPVLEGKGLFAMVSLSWTFDNKSYYTYELYASKVKDFNPDFTNRIFEGKASAFLHEVKPRETWYYRARAKNTHGVYTSFSAQISVTTSKVSDAAQYFGELAIADALIQDLRLDRGWIGKLYGDKIDARELSVTDGNNNKTLWIDSFGNVALNVASLKIANNKVYTSEEADNAIGEAIKDVKTNILPNGSFNDGLNGWNKESIIISGPSFSNEKNWCNFYTSTPDGERYGENIFDILQNKVYNFSILLAQYSSSKSFYRIKIQTKNKNSSVWEDIKEFTGDTTGTRSNPDQLNYTFKTGSSIEKCRVWIGKLDGEVFDIYVADLFMGTGTIYARKSDFQILDTKIASKVEENEFGTLVEQNAHAVKIAWNNISNYVQFENGGLSIYNGSVTTSQKRAVFDESGNHFWRDGYYLGKIGTNKYSGNSNLKGIVFDLESDGAYMTWAVEKTASATSYSMIFTYANKTIGDYSSGKLHAGCDIDMHNYTLRNVNFEGGGINGTLAFTQIVSMNTNGTAARWYNNSKLVFKNGILIDATWGNG